MVIDGDNDCNIQVFLLLNVYDTEKTSGVSRHGELHCVWTPPYFVFILFVLTFTQNDLPIRLFPKLDAH